MLTELFAFVSGLPVVLQLVVILIAPVGYFLYRFANNQEFRIDILSTFKKNHNKIEKDHITCHDIFKNKNLYKYSIKDIHFKDEIKTDLFRLILNEKNESVIKNCKTFIDNIDSVEDVNLNSKMQDTIELIVDDYELKISSKMKDKFWNDSDEIYDIVYTKGFAEYHKINILLIINLISSFDKSGLNKNQKVYMFLNLLNIALYTAIVDCETFFNDLNGNLKLYNIKYYGNNKK